MVLMPTDLTNLKVLKRHASIGTTLRSYVGSNAETRMKLCGRQQAETGGRLGVSVVDALKPCGRQRLETGHEMVLQRMLLQD